MGAKLIEVWEMEALKHFFYKGPQPDWTRTRHRTDAKPH